MQVVDSEPVALEKSERVIGKGMKTFISVGLEFVRIRDQKLYRHKYKTFAIYCEKRWKITATRARQICAAALVTAKLKEAAKSETNVSIPQNVSEARNFVGLKDIEAVEASKEATKKAESQKRKPNAKDFKEAVAKLRPKDNRPKVTLQTPNYDAYTSRPAIVATAIALEPLPNDIKSKAPPQLGEKHCVNGYADPPRTDLRTIGQVNYEAYCEHRQWKGFNGDKLPQWPDVKPALKEGWTVAARAVLDSQ